MVEIQKDIIEKMINKYYPPEENEIVSSISFRLEGSIIYAKIIKQSTSKYNKYSHTYRYDISLSEYEDFVAQEIIKLL